MKKSIITKEREQRERNRIVNNFKKVIKGIGYIVYGTSITITASTVIYMAFTRMDDNWQTRVLLAAASIALTPILWLIGRSIWRAIVAEYKRAAGDEPSTK